MSLRKLALGTVILTVLCAGCEDDSNPVGPIPPIAVVGQIISYQCSVPNGYVHPPVDATVEIIDNAGYSVFVPVKDSGWFWTRLYEGEHTIVIETANTWPDTLDNVQIQKDTSLVCYISDDFTYTDKLDFCFYYREGQPDETQEREIIDEINRLTDCTFLPHEATREVIDLSFAVIVIYGVPVEEGCRVWLAYNSVREIINKDILELPPDFYIDPGSYFCLD